MLLTDDERYDLVAKAINLLTDLFPGYLPYNTGMSLHGVAKALREDAEARKKLASEQ